MATSQEDLTIGTVAAETGTSPEVLRMWEQRYGFPVPARQASGHRRYSARHIAQIRQVQRDRDAGMSLEAAIARTRSAADQADSSIFAGLRRRWPEQAVQVLSKPAMDAASRAIEDECLAQASRPVLIGAFQRERFYRQSERRWRELARTASWAVVFADFASSRMPRGAAAEVAVPGDDPLLREWAVIAASPAVSACVVAVELAPDDRDGRGRRFEALWSADPSVVADAVRIAARLAKGVPGADSVADSLPGSADVPTVLRHAGALVNRTIAYLDA